MLRTLQLSFTNWSGFGDPTATGASNYTRMVGDDPAFWKVMTNTVVFATVVGLGTVGMGFLLAYALYRKIPGGSFFKVVLFLTFMLSQAATGVIWRSMLDPLLGPVDPLLQRFGIDAPSFLGDPSWVLATLSVKAIWQFSAVPMLVFLAAMEDIPASLIEAARIDGATRRQILSKIILPLIRPVVVIILLLQFVFTMRTFDTIWVMTEGGPNKASAVMGTEIYQLGFRQARMGYASAWAVVLTIFVGVLGLVYLKVFQRKAVEY